MTIVNDNPVAWVLRRVGLISVLTLLAINAAAITLVLIIFGNSPSGPTDNFVYLVALALNAFLFWAMLVALLVCAIGVFFERFRYIVKTGIPWFAASLLISGVSWSLLKIFASSS